MGYNSVAIFISLAVVGSQMCEISRNSERIRAYGMSRSSKVIDLVVNWKRMCDFLLSLIVTLDVSLTVLEILTFKARKLLVSPPLPCLTPPLGGNPLQFLGETYPTKLEGWWKFWAIAYSVLSNLCSRLRPRTILWGRVWGRGQNFGLEASLSSRT